MLSAGEAQRGAVTFRALETAPVDPGTAAAMLRPSVEVEVEAEAGLGGGDSTGLQARLLPSALAVTGREAAVSLFASAQRSALLHAQARNRLLLQDSRVPKRMSVPLHAASLGLSPWGGGAQPVQL